LPQNLARCTTANDNGFVQDDDGGGNGEKGDFWADQDCRHGELGVVSQRASSVIELMI
jgi:hypothetical protein